MDRFDEIQRDPSGQCSHQDLKQVLSEGAPRGTIMLSFTFIIFLVSHANTLKSSCMPVPSGHRYVIIHIYLQPALLRTYDQRHAY